MRLIIGISLLLLGVGTLSCRLEGTTGATPKPTHSIAWVRTTDGWERPGDWYVTYATTPRLHPLVVAAGQGLVSILALVAFRDEEESES
jgi:hypothetical protein